jgi:hypothetical protein
MSILKFVLIFFILFFILWEIESYFNLKFYKYFFPKYYDDDKNSELSIKNMYSPKIDSEIKNGESIAKSSSIVICGLARNISHVLEKTQKKLEKIGSFFNKYHIVIFENDSTDNTREIIKKWSKENKNVTLIDCVDENGNSNECKFNLETGYDMGAISLNRSKKMAVYREQYLNYVKKKFKHYDYMLVADLDIEGNMNYDGLFHSLSQNNWGGICINGRGNVPVFFGLLSMMYDTLAYVPKDSDYNNIKYNVFKNLFYSNYEILNSEKLIEVTSAFNGYSLYKIPYVINSTYIGDTCCEHINLHINIIKNGGKIYINPLWTGYFNLQGPQGPINLLKMFIK